MISKYNNISLAIGVPGLILQVVGMVMDFQMKAAAGVPVSSDAPMEPLAALVVVLGFVMLIIGLGFYAKAKGHTPLLGILGLLSLIGLIILACLPDKTIR